MQSGWLLIQTNEVRHADLSNGFRANFAALFVLNYWLREFFLSATTTDAVV